MDWISRRLKQWKCKHWYMQCNTVSACKRHTDSWYSWSTHGSVWIRHHVLELYTGNILTWSKKTCSDTLRWVANVAHVIFLWRNVKITFLKEEKQCIFFCKKKLNLIFSTIIGAVHTNMKILGLFTHPQLIFFLLWNTKQKHV